MQAEEKILISLSLSELEGLFKKWVRDELSFHLLPTNSSTPIQDEFLTVAQAAELLSVAIPTIYGYAHTRTIPYMKRRGRLYFSKSELLKWVQSGRRSTFEEIREEARKSLER